MNMAFFEITAEKILVLMCFFAVGCLLAKRKLVPENAPGVLSRLMTLFFCPALTISSMAQNLSRGVIAQNARLMLVCAAVTLVFILLSGVLAPLIARGEKDLECILRYNLVFTNYGYIGYPLIQGVLGDSMLSLFMLYAVPLSLFCYTYGRMALEEQKRISWKFLSAPMTMALWIGLFFGLTELPLPAVVSDVLSGAGSCMGPVAMLVTGMTLSKTDLRSCFGTRRNYLLTALRLIVLPLAAVAVLYPLGVRGEALFFAGCALALPFGSNPVIFREAVGLDAQKAMGMTMLSYLFSLVTVPFMFTLLQRLSGLAL